jgi:hypothetical protein
MKNKTKVQQNWAKAVNNPDFKPYKDEMYGNKVKGKINGKHHVMYNALRELPLDRGFIAGSDTLNYHILAIKRNVDWFHCRDIQDTEIFPFYVPMTEFKEKWDEALRLYSSS